MRDGHAKLPTVAMGSGKRALENKSETAFSVLMADPSSRDDNIETKDNKREAMALMAFWYA